MMDLWTSEATGFGLDCLGEEVVEVVPLHFLSLVLSQIHQPGYGDWEFQLKFVLHN